jgi:hypothetical protein
MASLPFDSQNCNFTPFGVTHIKGKSDIHFPGCLDFLESLLGELSASSVTRVDFRPRTNTQNEIYHSIIEQSQTHVERTISIKKVRTLILILNG